MAQRKLWTPEEDQIVIQLVQEYGTKKWTTLSDEMKKISSNYQRSSKQIRERWHNHLDPSVNKKQWSLEEETILFEAHRKYGNRWKQISSLLQRRTDNYVKNHFYSTLRRALRRINKYLGQKNSTTQMRLIKPSILSYLIQLSQNDPEIRNLVSKIFEFSHHKPIKSQCKNQQQNSEKNRYTEALKKLQQINLSYIIRRERNSKIIHSPKNGTISDLTISELDKIEIKVQPHMDEQDQEREADNWEQESSRHGQMLPEVERPQIEDDLLSQKYEQQQAQPQDYWGYSLQNPKQMDRIDTSNLFQF